MAMLLHVADCKNKLSFPYLGFMNSVMFPYQP